jgi:ribosomal protein S18 acetylase RimI-like enzyme
MASITVPVSLPQIGNMRPLNILHDLPQVADLIELCFESTMDDEGQSYLQQMRRAGADHDFLQWAGKVVDSTSMPLAGFIWEEAGKIVGNVSLVYQSHEGQKMAMIANVATHPNYRRHGIGRALTEQAMTAAQHRGAQQLWLQVRDDNPTAIHIYADLGFEERGRRTMYYTRTDASPAPSTPPPPQFSTTGLAIVTQMQARSWPLQRQWLERAHPAELSWYAHWDWDALGPGWKNWLRRLFAVTDGRQWAAQRGEQLQASVHWMPTSRASNVLWPAAPADGDPGALSLALETARRDLSHFRRLGVEYPAGQMVEAIEAAGFAASRTLIWMRAGATPGPAARMESRKESSS